MNDRLGRLFAGAIAGLAATLPMSLVMMKGHRKRSQWNPLPPRQITAATIDSVGLDESVSEETEAALTVLNHFAYGASMGGLYGVLADRRSPVAGITTGVCYGVGVWAISYLGWLPATGLYRSAAEDSRERNLLMLGAHVVWGGTLGCLTEVAYRQIQNQNRQQRQVRDRAIDHTPLAARSRVRAK